MDVLIILDEIFVQSCKSQINASINNFQMIPYPNRGNIYESLFEKKKIDPRKEKSFPLVEIKRDKRNHNIEIVLNKMQIVVVNRYFEEVLAFKNEISAKFSDLRNQLLSKVKNHNDLVKTKFNENLLLYKYRIIKILLRQKKNQF